MHKYAPRVIAILAIAAIAVAIRNFGAKTPEMQAGAGGTRLVMGTYANVTAVAKDQATIERSIKAAYEQLDNVDEMMSDYKADSELSVVNREAFERPVKVSDPLFEVLKASLAYSRVSEGAFDITVGPVVQLWRGMAKEGGRPTEEQLEQAKARVGYRNLILDEENRTVRFAVEGMRLDLGGIAKGYGIDRAVEAMRAAGAAGGLVDVGGDIRCFGKSPKNTDLWRIGLDNPEGGDLLLVLNLSDTAVATSGDYRRFVMLDGRRISHIVDPAGGSGAGELTSVTVIAGTAMEADALATAVSVMGEARGMRLIEAVKGVEAILIPGGKEIEFVESAGAAAYIQRAE